MNITEFTLWFDKKNRFFVNTSISSTSRAGLWFDKKFVYLLVMLKDAGIVKLLWFDKKFVYLLINHLPIQCQLYCGLIKNSYIC